MASSKCSLETPVRTCKEDNWRESLPGDDGDGIFFLYVLFHLGIITLLLLLLLLARLPDVRLDTFADSKLRRTLANLRQVSTREAMRVLRKEVQVDIRGNRTLTESRREDRQS